MKIAFIGSHGVGKSAAASFLAAHLKRKHPEKSIKVIEENVREISKITGLNNPNFQKLAILDQLTKTEFYSNLYDIIICDRLAFDYMMYAEYNRTEVPSIYYKLAKEQIKSFDKIYFIRPSSNELINDGFRFTDVEERDIIDNIFEIKLNDFDVKYIEINNPYAKDFNWD